MIKVGDIIEYEKEYNIGACVVIRLEKIVFWVKPLNGSYERNTRYYHIGEPNEAHCWFSKKCDNPLWRKLQGET